MDKCGSEAVIVDHSTTFMSSFGFNNSLRSLRGVRSSSPELRQSCGCMILPPEVEAPIHYGGIRGFMQEAKMAAGRIEVILGFIDHASGVPQRYTFSICMREPFISCFSVFGASKQILCNFTWARLWADMEDALSPNHSDRFQPSQLSTCPLNQRRIRPPKGFHSSRAVYNTSDRTVIMAFLLLSADK